MCAKEDDLWELNRQGVPELKLDDGFYSSIFTICSQNCYSSVIIQVPYTRSSLNHDDVFILDTESKIYQFNGATSSIQERAKALEVVQHIKDTYHDGKCEIGIIGKKAWCV
jgi:hypothetical protein